MKRTRCCILWLCLCFSTGLFAQPDQGLLLRTGTVKIKSGISRAAVDSFNASAVRFQNKAFAILQFQSVPDARTRELLSSHGIELLEYIPNHAYTATLTGIVRQELLQQVGARALVQLEPRQKMEAGLAAHIFPSSAVKVAGTLDVWISFPKTFSLQEVSHNLKQANLELVSTAYSPYRILVLRLATGRLEELASFPFIEYIQPAPSGDEPLNFNSRAVSGASLLNASVTNGGKGLNGEGVVIGVGDNADVQTHIDFAGRLINRAAAPALGHGHHVTGTVGGAGNVNELYRGYASRSTIVSQAFNGIILNAPAYVRDYNMVITNNSYGDNIDCNYFGTYDLYARMMDQMAIDYPSLEHVFASGNSGLMACFPAQNGYHTVLGGYQSAKNVLTVGATSDSGLIADFSSRGPVKDGRTKPEIVTMGQAVVSAWPTNIYSYNNGTSMAAPAASGGLALLYQRYRQLHGGSDPQNGLMKALLCNGATDRGNAGPDYQYGFGWMDLVRSADMLEKSRYFTSLSANGSVNSHVISVPANTALLKVMLYWNDPAASPMSAHTLVNDLDLEVTDPSSATIFPRILDTANASLGSTAINGADHLNNMEQVVIDRPAAGTYTLKVKGTAIAQNPSQEYFLVYDIMPAGLTITSPAGGEGLVPSTNAFDMKKICWESYGFSSGTVTIAFSPDNGISWTTLASGVDINRAIYSWWVPNIAASQARIRITNNVTGEISTGEPFTIVGLPAVSLAPVQCEGYISINWTAPAGVTDYEIMMLRDNEMKQVAITTGTSYTFSGLSKDSTYWVTVRPRVNGIGGRRAVAISRQPNNGSCNGNISNGDLSLDAILSPSTGRKFTSSQLSAGSAITVRIKNLNDSVATGFQVGYSINGGAFIMETVPVTIPAGGTYNYTFSATADLSASGSYQIATLVKNNAPDNVPANDTAYLLVRQLDNQPVNLTSYYVDDMEGATMAAYEKDTTGLNGLERYDFSRTTPYGRLRTFINSGIAYSGTKALTLDANRYYPPGNTNYLVGTFNLSDYHVASHDIRLDFRYNNHSQASHANNRVWIRGNDTQSWIEVYNLDDNELEPGTYQKSGSIELSDKLAANGQEMGTSFQVRWGQFGKIAATDREYAAGYTFDDIRLYEVFNDLQMRSIDEPTAASCGLSNASSIKITLRNAANADLTNVPVKYRVNNGSWVTENIPLVAANSTIQYSFSTLANLSALGSFTIQALVDYSGDSFRENDTVSATVKNLPVISSFPYLQNFEGGTGYWYAEGQHNSWEYGTPVSNKINRAASGAKAWKTRLAGNYNDYEFSYLYSPCFDMAGMSNPFLSFSMALDVEDCGSTLCDAVWVEYSGDGIVWNKLGSSGSGTNWYNKVGNQLWSLQDNTRWHVATTSLPTGFSRLRLRFVMQSDPASNREGVAVDDIHIYDHAAGIYDGPTMSAPVTQSVTGNNWIDFLSGGKLVASVHPNNQLLGTTSVRAYINVGAVRHTSNQYYHNRNLTIQPENRSLSDSVTVRFYFLDSEVDSLARATGCPVCAQASSAYEMGVSKYSDPVISFENGSVDDDNQGMWHFIPSDQVNMVPFDKGYYAEFRVKDFSEFWLSSGGFDRSLPLPVKLLDFTAQKVNGDVLLKWNVAEETDVDRYELELARGYADVQSSHFEKIGAVPGSGNTSLARSYSFTDEEPDKFGSRFYRLKIVDANGTFRYSPVRLVTFSDPVLWKVYPNPSSGEFNLVYQLNGNELLVARLLDAKGSLIREYRKTANGFAQKLHIDLSPYPNGPYLLQIGTGSRQQAFKLYKQ